MTYAALLDGVSRPKLYKVERLNKLYEAETNLDYAFSLMVQHQGHALLALFLEDCEFGASVLNRAGLTVVYEDELLR